MKSTKTTNSAKSTKFTKNIYTITEYESFVSEHSFPGNITLPKETFDLLEKFVLSTPFSPMELRVKRGIGKIITAKNYVGVLLLKDGTMIEILPKIFSCQEHAKARMLLIEMLKTLKSSPFKTLQTAPLESAKLPLLEIFIQMFLTEVFRLVKHGLKCSYQLIQSNETQFKGKWKVAQHITKNYAHKERVFSEYELYHVDRAENRLLKATLQYLYQISSSAKNKNTIKILLHEFREVTASTHYQEDFAQCRSDRTMKHYETALLWCRTFLKGNSFTPFSGAEMAAALLFPMELLFERYVGVKCKQHLSRYDVQVLLQDTSYHLFDEPRRQFLLKPDIVIIRNRDQAVFLLDTKWKQISPARRQYGISSGDMYQMYVYQKKYHAEHARLVYPLSSEAKPASSKLTFSEQAALKQASLEQASLERTFLEENNICSIEPIVFRSIEKQEETTVLVDFVDLFHMESFLNRLVQELCLF